MNNMTATKCITTLLLLLLTGFSPRVAGAGTCTCDNNAFDVAGTGEKCYKTAGTAKKACTLIANDDDTKCGAASVNEGDCKWTEFHCKETDSNSCDTLLIAPCKAAKFCQWNTHSCMPKSGNNTANAPNLCATYQNQTDCDKEEVNCAWTSLSGGAACSAGCSGFQNSADCAADKEPADATVAMCTWTAIATHKFCACAVEGKPTSDGDPTCYAAAQTPAYCANATAQGAGVDTGCQKSGARLDYCTWFEAGPFPSETGTCVCNNPGYDATGKIEQCWKTPGTKKTSCTNTGTSSACAAASVNLNDCEWTDGTSTCDCTQEGQDADGVATCHALLTDAKDGNFCYTEVASDATASTGCAAPGKVTHCTWLAPASVVPEPSTAGTCACAYPGWDVAGNAKCFKTPGTAVGTCTGKDSTACAADDAPDCQWTAKHCRLASDKKQTATKDCSLPANNSLATCTAYDGDNCEWVVGACGCIHSGFTGPAGKSVKTQKCWKDAAVAGDLCSGSDGGTATTKDGCAVTALADHCKWMIAESACTGAASPTPCPESSASAPGALLAILAGLLAYLRC